MSEIRPFHGVVGKTSQNSASLHLMNVLERLNSFLRNETFLINDRFGISDAFVACDLLPFYHGLMQTNPKLPFLNRWFLTVVNQKEFCKVVDYKTFGSETKSKQPKAKTKNQAKVTKTKCLQNCRETQYFVPSRISSERVNVQGKNWSLSENHFQKSKPDLCNGTPQSST